jgi:coenzyme PQQ precursor peptide PqqA
VAICPGEGECPPEPTKGRRFRLSALPSKTYFSGLRGSASKSVALLDMKRETTMAWTTPTLVEICIGLEINGYLPAEF